MTDLELVGTVVAATDCCGDRGSMLRLLRRIARGEVAAVEVELPRFTPATTPAERLREAALYCFTGGAEHQAVCADAALWLTSRGRAWTTRGPDLDCPGGRADVATVDGSLLVEAGDTRADKVMRCLDDGREVLLAPYGAPLAAVLLSPAQLPPATRLWQARVRRLAKVTAKLVGVPTRALLTEEDDDGEA